MKSEAKTPNSTTSRKHFREGDLVEVVTVNRANGDGATNRAKMARKERWRAIVVGRSLMGAGWWIVKKVNRRSSSRRTYTIPESEVLRIVRRPIGGGLARSIVEGEPRAGR